jgi:hypothetical protein
MGWENEKFGEGIGDDKLALFPVGRLVTKQMYQQGAERSFWQTKSTMLEV